MYRVLLVDDQELFRDIARDLLDASGVFRVVAEAIDGVDAATLYPVLSPDLVLMDVQTARTNGFDATREILEAYPEANVVLVSARPDPESERAAEELGALKLIAKRDLDAAELESLLKNGRAESRAVQPVSDTTSADRGVAAGHGRHADRLEQPGRRNVDGVFMATRQGAR